MPAANINQRILIVDRDIAAVGPLLEVLSGAGFLVRAVAIGAAAVAAAEEHPPHLIIVDWNMPGSAALEIINRIRKGRSDPRIRVIVLSSGGEHEAVAALNFGADDFVSKPFSAREVLARACAILRCRSREQRSILSCESLELDVTTHRVTAAGRTIDLRGIEYRLLQFLMSHPGRTFNRSQLLAYVWGECATAHERTVDVNVQRLRKTLGDFGYGKCVQTIRGFGYCFATPTRPAQDIPVSIL